VIANSFQRAGLDQQFPFESDLIDVHCDCLDQGQGPVKTGPHGFCPIVDADQRQVIQGGPHAVILYRVAEETWNLKLFRGKTQACWVVVEGSTHTNEWSGRILDEQEAAAVRDSQATSDKPQDDNTDGPVAPDGFRYRGKIYSPLARGPFRTLFGAWTMQGRCVDRDDLAETLYEDREETLNETTLRSLRGELNDFFRAHKILYNAKVRGRSIAIKDGAPPAARPIKSPGPARRKKTRR